MEVKKIICDRCGACIKGSIYKIVPYKVDDKGKYIDTNEDVSNKDYCEVCANEIQNELIKASERVASSYDKVIEVSSNKVSEAVSVNLSIEDIHPGETNKTVIEKTEVAPVQPVQSEVELILQLHNEGLKPRAIADQVGCTAKRVYYILTKEKGKLP